MWTHRRSKSEKIKQGYLRHKMNQGLMYFSKVYILPLFLICNICFVIIVTKDSQ